MSSPPRSEDAGIRRRHSAPLEGLVDDLNSSLLGEQDTTRPIGQETESNIGGPRAQQPSQDPSPPRRKNDQVHHVRFSSDVTRQGSGLGISGSDLPSSSTASPSNKRPIKPALSVDTAQASGSVYGERNTSATWSSNRSPQSPPSPKPVTGHGSGRTRGFSLRRSMFYRHVDDQLEGPNSDIELSDVELENSESSDQPNVHLSKIAQESATSEPPRYDHDINSYRRSKQDKASRLQGISALPHYEDWVREKASRNKYLKSIKNAYEETRKFILRQHEIPPSKEGRKLDIDASRKKTLIDERTNQPYVNNTISSTRYNAWNFVPRQIFAQFSKLANFYFLLIASLQLVPGLSTTGQYTTLVPLLVFVSVSIAREGYDDIRRHRLDKEENAREASVLHAYQPTDTTTSSVGPDSPAPGPRHWATIKWSNVQVGDIVKLKRNEAAPADLVLLNSRGENGIAYVETMALDGETNLKSKQAPQSLAENCNSIEKLAARPASVVIEDPNLDLYNFQGSVCINGNETLPLTLSQVIFRGSIIRNTPEIYGFVVYSGEECKIRMNTSKNARIKAPSLQFVVNRIVVLIVIFVILLAVYNTVAYELWDSVEDKLWYLHNSSVSFGQVIVSFIIMFNTMIPLSLYVSLEIIKVCQMFLLNDIDMYHEESNTPFEARTATINEELGQISYIFSDKTGTLTDNLMKFRKISVAGTAWLHDSDLKQDAVKEAYRKRLVQEKRRQGKKKVADSRPSVSSTKPRRSQSSALFRTPDPNSITTPTPNDSPGWRASARPGRHQAELQTMELIYYITRRPTTAFARKARFFLICIALCHTCLPENMDDGSIQYQAASPDELALVEAAQELGFIVVERSSRTISVKISSNGFDQEPQIEAYEVLDVIEFSSRRKRMSIVVRFPDQRICIISKGADSVIMDLLRLSSAANRAVAEIEKKSSQRKSREASIAIARKSEQASMTSPFSPIGRTSFATQRSSIKGLGRNSLGSPRPQSLRHQVSGWLAGREQGIDAAIEEDTDMYSPRPSGQFGRPSMAPSEARSSLLLDDNFELVDETMVQDESIVIERCFQHINDFATDGLRTLLYGYRFIEEDEYSQWKKIYHDATTSIFDRQENIEKAGDIIERNFELAGATAIEDKLQKGVPETIDKLRRANIKIWMLTGDKRETAINIGQSCRLIKDYSSVTILDHESGRVEKDIAAALVEIDRNTVGHSVVVVDGETLSMIESDEIIQSLFLNLAIVADAIICCRASPSQKAGLVKAVRRKVNRSITLAIGDGANDIAMIQEAHVGIGITGKEGLQAARTSDYSIAQFRFLSKLLLVHGRWNYLRICKYTLATFWKEMMFYLTQALYQRWTGYTGTSLYENWSLSMWNTLFTSLPVIFLGIFERDLSPSTLIAVPELYTNGQRNGGFNFKLYLWWMFIAASDAMLVFFIPLRLFAQPEQIYNDVFPFGDLCFTTAVLFVSSKLLFFEMHTRSLANALGAFLSIGGWFLWNLILASTYQNNVEYDVKNAFLTRFTHQWSWWLTLLLTLFALSIVEIGQRAVKSAFFPSDTDVFQSLEKDRDTKRRFEDAARLELAQGWDERGVLRGDLPHTTDASNDEEPATPPSPAGAGAEPTPKHPRTSAEQLKREREVAELLRLRAQGHAVELAQPEREIPLSPTGSDEQEHSHAQASSSTRIRRVGDKLKGKLRRG